MSIFSKIILKFKQIKTIVLDMICDSTYLENLNNSFIELNRSQDTICKVKKLQEFFDNCNILLKAIDNRKSKALLNEIIQFKTSFFIENMSFDEKELESNYDNLETEKIIQILNSIKNNDCVHYKIKRWPQYYETLSIYPSISDITTKRVILSQNILKGRYDNVEHYIDVQFRLLREDFIAPMREGIQCYKEVTKFNPDVKMIPNMHIYFNVKIKVKDVKRKKVHIVNFYTKDDCSNDSKRFMPQSMLVFSNDNFDTMFFALVIRISQTFLSSLKTLVIKPLDHTVSINMKSSYTMAESVAFFLPYMYTMNVLKTFNHINFPMKSYIVFGKTEPKTPAYLTCKSKIYTINGLQFDILNNNLWPDNKFLGLDSAQSMAFKAALTKEFTIIQGPPGTGKTYIGLQIVKSIIENMYKTNILKNPIIVVCYTNHALDQFLEGLINITKCVTRIGRGCKSDIVKSHVLRNTNTFLAQKRLKNSYVVGFTTTGASMKRSLLLKLKPPIVIVEEAAEVLESHVVASLTKFCQHVILIGDHKQLRPRTASFRLSKLFNLDVSLFERMVKNGFPCYTLDTQHRMRPEISALIKPIYPFLRDHEIVKDRSDIRGVTKNIYFIHHNIHEEKVIGSNSYKNSHEVNFFMKFARYLFSQGYHQHQITLLVTYREELLELQKIRESSSVLEDFRIECVDGFQGEENDIILLSLVRSNIDNNIGFLNIQNRICVALSRARNGLYVMGNMDNLIHSSIWKEISLILINQQSLGNKLGLRCEIHKDWTINVSSSRDFDKVQCLKVCNMIMDCGHHCSQLCHYYDQSHKTLYRCKKEYSRTLSCGFKLKIECWMRFLTYECPLYKSIAS
ncbi:NFX1-type zinc finger-containing protein 1-like isoform X1 [Sipha flava]|uniref:NFX1-type zinc finger-containing protein 1-like isoform X1 n=2 Tax=Sipha flava TaxID=143950 RepID=A0A8B8FB11_9HEMI|nr:NFX1-type zinc finger-containing protein 1-like isoform X1 [Sipha flava]